VWIAAGVEALRSTRLDARLAATLAAAGDRAVSQAEAMAARLPLSPIHGDASPDNVVRDGTHLLLTDFEKGSIGPGSYDLAPLRMLSRRFDYDLARVEQVLRAYGPRPNGDIDTVLTQLFEVVVIAGAIAPYAAHVAFEDELRLRLRSLRRHASETPWTPHRKLLAQIRRGDSPT
jgi:Ser/Thr protein kinase RdoA (MazF antagonist)